MMLESHYKYYQFLTNEVALFEQRIEKAMEPYADKAELLISIPGVDRIVAWHLLAELGVDVSAFPDSDHAVVGRAWFPGRSRARESTRAIDAGKAIRLGAGF